MISVSLLGQASTTPPCAAEEADEPPAAPLRCGALQLWPSQPFHPTVSTFSRCFYSRPSSRSGMSNSAQMIANRQALLALPRILSRLLPEAPSELFYTVGDHRGDCNYRSGIRTHSL